MFRVDTEKIQGIESSVEKLKNGDRDCAVDELKTKLSGFLDKNISVRVVPNKNTKQFFGMCVIPERSVIDKIVDCISTNKGTIKTLSSLWEKTKSWNVEIDEQILSSKFTTREVTAIMLHECAHVIQTNSVPIRLSTIVQFQLAKMETKSKTGLRDKTFRNFLKIPIIHSCTCSSADGIKKEIKADKFAVKCGYGNDIISAIRKVESIGGSNLSTDSSIAKSVEFSTSGLTALQARREALDTSGLERFMKRIPNNYLHESTEELLGSLTVMEDKIPAKFESAEEKYYTEAFFFNKKKKMEPIMQMHIDYIAAKLNDMRTNDDRLMLLSYANSKLELCEYYHSILRDPKLAKKYIIPNTIQQLNLFKEELNVLRNKIINKPLKKFDDFVVFYPKGYEG